MEDTFIVDNGTDHEFAEAGEQHTLKTDLTALDIIKLRDTRVGRLLELRESLVDEVAAYDEELAALDAAIKPAAKRVKPAATATSTGPFANLTLAAVATAILAGGPAHGKVIEKQARAGGFTGGTNNFQNYLQVALKRAGGFKNIGANTWKLDATAKADGPKRKKKK